MGFLTKFRAKVSPASLSWPQDLTGQIDTVLKEQVKSPHFEINATPGSQDARASVVTIGKDIITAKSISQMLSLIGEKSNKERKVSYKEHPDCPPEARCMSCNKALMAASESKVVPNIELDIWLNNSKGNLTALCPSIWFCSYTHLANFISIVPDEEHLVMAARYLSPGALLYFPASLGE